MLTYFSSEVELGLCWIELMGVVCQSYHLISVDTTKDLIRHTITDSPTRRPRTAAIQDVSPSAASDLRSYVPTNCRGALAANMLEPDYSPEKYLW